MRFSDQEIQVFCQAFEMPQRFAGMVERFFSEDEIALAIKIKKDPFHKADFSEDFIRQEYKRGFISKVDAESGNYQLNNFYGMLDVFVVSRKEEFDEYFSYEEKRALDEWYFDEYYKGLLTVGGKLPTEDIVLPLDDMLQFIDSQKDRPVYLNNCDCKSLTGECGLPRRTCITYKNGINTFADRGLSERINAEKAKQIVIEADKAGLIHTCNSNGICNCCDDCCYLFRCQKLFDSYGAWPATKYIVEMNREKCVKCGLCQKRCRMAVFRKKDGAIDMDTAPCAGCGLCVNTCPVGALSLVPRS